MQSLKIDNESSIRLKNLGHKLPNLKHLVINHSTISPNIGFVEYLSASNLESISMSCRYFGKKDSSQEIVKSFNKLKQLNKITLFHAFRADFSFVNFDERFVAFYYQPHSLIERSKVFTLLPTGPGVKYLKLRLDSESAITNNDVEVLKEKFPKLQLLILPKDSKIRVSRDRITFQVRRHFRLGDRALFDSVPCVVISEDYE